MDATVKLTLGTGGCQHVMAEITIDGETRRITKTRNEWLEKDTVDIDSKFSVVEANLAAYLKTEETALAKDAKPLDWSVAVTGIQAKTFKV